jgi:ribose transport system ATP-binding protein
MDEPTSCLTLTETQRLLEVMGELRSQGVSIIYISHRLGEVHQIADRVVVLRDGKNAGNLSRGQITHDAMVRLMVGRDLDKFYDGRGGGRTDGEGSGPRRNGLGVSSLRTTAFPGHAVSFEVRRGEILGFAGLVGAGRSEVARALFGIDPRRGGTLTLDGRPLQIASSRDAISHGIFLVPEDRRHCGLVAEMTVVENMTLPDLWTYTLGGLIRPGAEREVARRQCHALSVKTPSVDTTVANLSGGNQQKVVLGKWLSMRPQAMIFDEPTRGIDVGAKAEIYRLIRALATGGVAVMMISSELEEVLHVSDRIAVMHEGRLMGVLARRECTEEKVMQLAVGRDLN